ncbi:hypothetical protein [Listeria monocytogenes]|uniref:hypothetical protein n=1 Tax=Listeria monocytogenes TaxID=1639 RepID=UPI0002593D45|nr:hypothetical protein [Listeria monocytogenes]AFH78673.1 hypothetical protein MUO_00500 [Listeria monocytogenes 07PF0776]
MKLARFNWYSNDITSNINSELADSFQGYTDVRNITVNPTVDVGVSGSLTAVLGQIVS